MTEKAFIFTTDALLAVLLSAFLAFAIFATLDKASGFEDRTTPMQRLSEDALAVMEETGVLARAVQESQTEEMRGVLNGFPGSICAEIAVYSNSTLLLAESKAGCSCQNATDITVARRSFVALDGSAQVEAHAELAGCVD